MLAAIRRESFIPTRTSKLCSQHFCPDDFIIDFGKKSLKPDTVPSIFNFPKHLVKKPVKLRSQRPNSVDEQGTSFPSTSREVVHNSQDVTEIRGVQGYPMDIDQETVSDKAKTTKSESKTLLGRRDLKEAVRCIHGFTRHCMSKDDRSHFRTLFHGTGLMVHELCRNGTYQDEYLKHAPCMTLAANENEVCFRRYTRSLHQIQTNSPEINISEPDIVTVLKKKRAAADEGIKNVCCAFQEYVECSTQSVRRRCGDSSADFSRTFLDRMSSSMIQLHCTEYGRRECGMISSSSPAASQTVLTLVTMYLFQYFLR